jgi:hypothetical protein
MMVRAKSHEPTAACEVVRNAESEQVRIEVMGGLEVGHIEAKVA